MLRVDEATTVEVKKCPEDLEKPMGWGTSPRVLLNKNDNQQHMIDLLKKCPRTCRETNELGHFSNGLIAYC